MYLRPIQQQQVIMIIKIRSTTAPPADAPMMMPIELLEFPSSAGTLVVTMETLTQI